MNFHDFDEEAQFRAIWEAVKIHRWVDYGLFTFGESDLPYYLIIDGEQKSDLVQVLRGKVSVTRPRLITPDSMHPEFRNFFEEKELGGMVDFLIARTAAFKNLKIENQQIRSEMVSDSVEEIVSRLNRQLDTEEEDRVAILSAPYGLGGAAVLKYTTERIISSTPDNIQELRERGFLPD